MAVARRLHEAILSTERARIDYFDAYDFICLSHQAGSARWEVRILDTFYLLADFPYTRRVHPGYAPDYLRFWIEGQYLVIYDPQVNPTMIIGVLHCAQDLFGRMARRVVDYELTDEESR